MNDKSSIKYIIGLSIPIFFANLAIPLVGIVDTALMGNLSNKTYLAATTIASSFFSMIFWSFGFLRMGTVGVIAKSYGEKNFDEIINVIFRNLIFVIIIFLSLIIFKNQLFNICIDVFEMTNETKLRFADYFNIRIYSSIGELTIYIITGVFIGLQKTKISSLTVGTLSVLNIIFSIVLVKIYNLEVKGVAYGTLFASIITCTIFLFYTFLHLKKIAKINFNIDEILNLNKIKNLIEINLNIFVRTILLTFSFLWFTYLGSKIGEEYVAANAILLNLIFLSSFILDAYAFSTEGIIGYSIGSKNLNLFKKVVKNSFILTSITGLIISLSYLFFKNYMIGFMTDIESIKTISLQFSFWLIILPFVSSFCYQFDGIFIGASQTKELRNAMIISVSLYLILSFYFINIYQNFGLWLAFTIFLILRAITLLYYFKRIYIKFN